MPFHYKATHSSGFVHLRKSATRASYTHAVVGKRSGDISCSSTMGGAHKRMEELTRYGSTAGWEVVELVEIDAAEHAKILKAGVRKHKVVFMGKPYTSTTKLEREPWTHAVGYFLPEHVVTCTLAATASPKWHEQHPDGIYRRTDREQRGVWWFSSESEAQSCIDRHLAETPSQWEIFTKVEGEIPYTYTLLVAS